MPLEITEKSNAISLTKKSVVGNISFKNVSFSYTENSIHLEARERNWNWKFTRSGEEINTNSIPKKIPTESRFALRNISFDIKPCEFVAVVGHSGAGKSTIASLLMRLYDVTEGQILIDGIDLRDLTLASITDIFGIVSQETLMFNDTIRENICINNKYSEEELINACKIANIHNHIVTQLPNGYDTLVGESGYALSGGEKQRISIARVVIRNAPIIIFDEATSSLDTISEKLIQTAMENVLASRTCIIIAHRLSTILRANKIIVLKESQIVEMGTHMELLTKGGDYAALYAAQLTTKNL